MVSTLANNRRMVSSLMVALLSGLYLVGEDGIGVWVDTDNLCGIALVFPSYNIIPRVKTFVF